MAKAYSGKGDKKPQKKKKDPKAYLSKRKATKNQNGRNS
jgi:hypothetical protein|tara:strand:- start:668 stop:784 length:117 start_codon:yes stop_codon:yes gene_type:complete